MELKILIFKFFFIFFLYFLIYYSNQNQIIISGKAKIIDGDTIHIENNKIRLHGIDAPELNQNCNYENKDWECGQQSKKYLEQLIDLNAVNCQVIGIDRYKRYIGICYVNKLNINKMLVKNGWAIAYRFYSKDYTDEEFIAKKMKIGIWKGDFEEPYIYRKNN